MPVTRFPNRANSIAERLTGFMAHLRGNGLHAGVVETENAMQALTQINPVNSKELRLALKSICAHDADRFSKFDDLFNAYWMNQGYTRQATEKSQDAAHQKNRWTNLSAFSEGQQSGESGALDLPDDDEEEEGAQDGESQLVASKRVNINQTDLREFMKPEDLAVACQVAESLAKAIRDRRSRRRKQAKRGAALDLRKMARQSVATGGEPFRLVKRHRPDRPVHLVALLDVSGSMTVYARVFLSFLKGLIGADQNTDAYLFHTQLVRISDALRDGDTFRAINRLSMMARGFGGGTKIASNLELFNDQYAAKQVTGRSVVLILSDGYDTEAPERMAKALMRLKKRGCKIIWLNPLKGWKEYEPVAKGMAAALPHLDLFAQATTLQDLAALEPHLGRL